MPSLTTQAVRGGAVTVVSRGLGVGLRIIALIALARLVDPATFGVVAIGQAVTTFVAAISTAGIGMASLRQTTLTGPVKNSLFAVQSLLGLALTLVLFVAAGPVARSYDLPELATVMQWLAVVPLLQGVSSQARIELVRHLRFGALASIEVTSQVVTLVVAVALAILGHALAAIALQLVVQLIVQAGLLWLMSTWKPGLRLASWHDVRDIIHAGSRIVLMNTFRMLPKSALAPVLGVWIAPSALGNFDRAQQLALQPINVVVDQLQRVAVPVLGRVADEPRRYERALVHAQGAASLAFGTGYLVFAAIGEPLIVALLGPKWALAGTVFAILSLGSAMYIHGQVMQWVFISKGATSQGSRLATVGYPAVLAISLLGVPYGVTGVAVANSMGWALYWPAAAIVASRAGDVSLRNLLGSPLRSLLTYSVPVALAAYLTHMALGSGPSVLALVGAVAASVFIALVLGVALPWVRADVALVLRSLRRGN